MQKTSEFKKNVIVIIFAIRANAGVTNVRCWEAAGVMRSGHIYTVNNAQFILIKSQKFY